MHAARLFLAIDLNRKVRTNLEQIQQELVCLYEGARWVTPEAMHITVKFFGMLPLREVYEISKGMAAVVSRHTPFTCQVRGIGAFPSLERPRVLWAGIGTNRDRVQELGRAALTEMEERGFGAEERAYVPHITLARFKQRRNYAAEVLEHLVPGPADHIFGDTAVEELVLYSSELTPSGPVYTRVDAWNIGGKDNVSMDDKE